MTSKKKWSLSSYEVGESHKASSQTRAAGALERVGAFYKSAGARLHRLDPHFSDMKAPASTTSPKITVTKPNERETHCDIDVGKRRTKLGEGRKSNDDDGIGKTRKGYINTVSASPRGQPYADYLDSTHPHYTTHNSEYGKLHKAESELMNRP